MGLNERIVVYGLILFFGLVTFNVIDKDRLLGTKEPEAVVEEPEAEPETIKDAEFGQLTVRALRVVTPDGKVLIEAGVDDESGSGFVVVSNSDGKIAARVGTDSGGAGAVQVHRKDGQRAAQLSVRWGSGNLLLENDKSLPAVTLGNAPKKGAVLQLSKEDGTVVASLTGGDKGGRLDVSNGAGKAVARILARKEIGSIEVVSGDETMTRLSIDAFGGFLTVMNLEGKMLFSAGTNKGGGIAQVLNNDRKIVARLGVFSGGTGYMSVYDAVGKRQGTMSAEKSGGVLGIYNRAGKKSVVIGPTEDQVGLVTVHDAAGNSTLEAFGGRKNGGGLTIYDTKGKLRAKLSNFSAGGGVSLHNNSNKLVGYVGAGNKRGSGLFKLYHTGGGLSMEASATEHGGFLEAYGRQAKALASIGVLNNGKGAVRIYSASGQTVAGMRHVTSGGTLYINNSAGKTVGQLTTDKSDSAGFLQIYNSSGTSLATMGTDTVGGYVRINHWNGKSAVELASKDSKGYCVTRHRNGTQMGLIGLR